ncbi:15573_t:CDS:2 [Funneliformis geosporum]|nr:15573_t:CDS:2 [Funneliformis geosporum]
MYYIYKNIISELKVLITKLEAKKTDKKARCIQIAKEILNKEPIIEYRPSFLNGLELDSFFQKYQITLEVQGAQIGSIALAEVWYDEKPEIVIPERIQKIKEFTGEILRLI